MTTFNQKEQLPKSAKCCQHVPNVYNNLIHSLLHDHNKIDPYKANVKKPSVKNHKPCRFRHLPGRKGSPKWIPTMRSKKARGSDLYQNHPKSTLVFLMVSDAWSFFEVSAIHVRAAVLPSTARSRSPVPGARLASCPPRPWPSLVRLRRGRAFSAKDQCDSRIFRNNGKKVTVAGKNEKKWKK